MQRHWIGRIDYLLPCRVSLHCSWRKGQSAANPRDDTEQPDFVVTKPTGARRQLADGSGPYQGNDGDPGTRWSASGSRQVGGYPLFYECLVYGGGVPSVSLAPTSIAKVASDHTVALSWPADHLGWHLQVQTNALGAGLGTNWVTLPGSDLVTSTNIRINSANGAVFYRLVCP
jgi:hypothetical protein